MAVQLVDGSRFTVSEVEIHLTVCQVIGGLGEKKKNCVWEVQSLVHQYPCHNYNMKTKEQSKQLREKITEK